MPYGTRTRHSRRRTGGRSRWGPGRLVACVCLISGVAAAGMVMSLPSGTRRHRGWAGRTGPPTRLLLDGESGRLQVIQGGLLHRGEGGSELGLLLVLDG